MKPLQPITLCHYRYDALDRLIGHTPSDERQLQRFYCKSRLTTEIQGAMKHSVVQSGDVLLAEQRYEDDALKTSLLATDQQRSVVQALNADHPPQPFAYSPYGHRPPENGMLSLLGFNGERPDPVTGHYLLGNGYRAFNSVLMRFNSPDSWSPFGDGGLNSYGYCLADPVNGYDETGHGPKFFGFKFSTKKSSIATLGKASSLQVHNSDLNTALRNPIFLDDYKYASSLPPPSGMQRLQDLAASHVPTNKFEKLPNGLVQFTREQRARRLLPLYERLSSTPGLMAETKLHPDAMSNLKKMISGKMDLPKGITIDDVLLYQQKMRSIRNPKHAKNKAKVNFLSDKSSALKKSGY